ncbi:hypothetical protein [Lactococcus phage CHPC971]|uniref:DUF7253 domain-containing protein n=1 Tax=Lactococcus phage CHPC971 TaxID=2575255 RepID=A0A4Y5N1N4_9CAUD|nr:hypothetical protein KMD16_gp11 [Lactococcus phage CHPC971]QCW07613.1 hypothetical protein [Lactococcus phage CHPC971]
MSRVNITIGINPAEPSEVRPGVFEYIPIEYTNVSASVLEANFNITDGQSVNQESNGVTRLSFIMSNDVNNRLGLLTYITYLGVKYKVSNVRIVRPRVEVTLGEVFVANE